MNDYQVINHFKLIWNELFCDEKNDKIYPEETNLIKCLDIVFCVLCPVK